MHNIFKKFLKPNSKGKLFSQIDGAAMGNHLGPTLADWFLGMMLLKCKSTPVIHADIIHPIIDQHFNTKKW